METTASVVLISDARVAREHGMQQALDHAERKVDNWGDVAMAFLHGYALSHDRFAGWMVTREAELTKAVQTPPTGKAWGSIFTKAARIGIIKKDGYAQDPNRHANPCPVWKSMVYKEAA